MRAHLKFTIEADYIKTGFNQLKEIGSYVRKDNKSIWTFPIDRIKEVEAILGMPIEFSEELSEVVSSRSPMQKEKAEIPEFKGKSGLYIYEHPTVFTIVEWRKVETGEGKIEIKEIAHELPSENVITMRKALGQIDQNRFKDKKIPCARIAEKVCELLKIDRFNRLDTGSFDWAKFFGNRRDYYRYYYLPLKVLAYKNEIEHHKNGKVTKFKLETIQASLTDLFAGAEAGAVG